MDGDGEGGGERAGRRRRRRATRAQGAPSNLATRGPDVSQPAAQPAAAPAEARGATPDAVPVVDAEPPAPTPAAASEPDAGKRRRRAPRENGERGLRDIVGAGRSQLGVSGALRARDLNRPSAEDLGEAERTVVIVRRNWTPDAHR